MPDATISAAGLRIVKLLVGNPPQTVADLVRAAGVTRTAVTEQLNELVAAGFVDDSIERRPGRGRPRRLFSVTHDSLVWLFPDSHHLVVPAIWWAIEDVGGPELTKQILRRVSRYLADHYSAKITAQTPKERLRQFVELLREEGVLVEITDEDGQPTLHKRSCPFISMVDEKRRGCTLDLGMMSMVVGRPVRRIDCRHERAPCCSFEIATDAGGDSGIAIPAEFPVSSQQSDSKVGRV